MSLKLIFYYFFLKVLYLASIFYCCVPGSVQGSGTRYVVALLGQDIQDSMVAVGITYELIISNKDEVPITVEITSVANILSEISVNTSSTQSYNLEHAMAMNGSEFGNKTLEVHSDNGDFVLQVFSKRENYVEGLLAIPIADMNGPNQVIDKTVYEYVVATFCAVGGYCQIAIAAAENNTEVFIDIPKHIEEIALCNKTSYFRTQRDTRFTMNRFDALQLETTYDLTGTVIFSFKPIAVFVGSRNVTNGNVVAHTMEQLVPSSHWGTEFVVQTLGSNGYGDILKIVSHYNNTEVTMSGFPSFNMTDRYQTVTRRLSNGMRSHIKGSHPIQVIQVSGLTYATQKERSLLSMTVVPSVQNAWTKSTFSCPTNFTTTQLTVVSEKASCQHTTASPNYNMDFGECYKERYLSRVKYTNYVIGTIDGRASEDVLHLENENNVSGILRCGQTSLMPTGFLYNKNVVGTLPIDTPEYPGGKCKEGGNASTSSMVPYSLNLAGYKEHVLHLRVQVCGSAVLQFTGSSTAITAEISYEGIRIVSCNTSCKYFDDRNRTDDSFNQQASINCASDMSLFWFRQSDDRICLGTGHKTEHCSKDYSPNLEDFIRIDNVASTIDHVSMSGSLSEATFNWDFIHVNGCKEYEPGWRCTDRLTNCSKYTTELCSEYIEFARYFCAKFCGICFADTYGVKFIVKTQSKIPNCSITVSAINKNTHVAATRTTIDDTVSITSTRNENGERYYDCSSVVGKFIIISDDDVAVVLFAKHGNEIQSTTVYPVDTYGTEFMLVGHGIEAPTKCWFLSEHTDNSVTGYFVGNKQNGISISDSEFTTIELLSFFSKDKNSDISGSVLRFDKPSIVLCFNIDVLGGSEYITYHLPIATWSTEYVVPVIDVYTSGLRLDGTLQIVTYDDNTIVQISNGFDSLHALYNKGDMIRQEIDLNIPYRINASGIIGVGLLVKDGHKLSFSLLPSVHNHHNTMLTSFPSEIYVQDVKNRTVFSVDKTLAWKHEVVRKYKNDQESFDNNTNTGETKYELTVVQTETSWFIVPGNVKAQHLAKSKKKICSISKATANGSIDNDCDGLKDESSNYDDMYGVYKEDSDLDGDFEDECIDNMSRKRVVNKTSEPVCFKIKEVPGQCWKPCSCKCSWVEKFNRENNMTHEQLVEAQQQYIVQYKKALAIKKDTLASTKARKRSAFDRRKSASNIGYAGIAIFAVTFITVVIMDLGALKRDALILYSNLRDGYESLCEFRAKRGRKKKEEPIEMRTVK